MDDEVDSAASEILKMVEAAPVSKVHHLLDYMASVASARTSSKLLATHMMLDVLDKSSTRELILVSALYLEHLANRRIATAHKPRKVAKLLNEIEAMYGAGEIDENLRGNMHAVRKLRNALTHELFYGLADWNPRDAPFLAEHAVTLPKRRRLIETKNQIMFKLLMMRIIEQLGESFPWIFYEDVPKAHRRRSGTPPGN